MSLLKTSADRVIANAPIIINRDSELYQRYWKQRLPRRVSIKGAGLPEGSKVTSAEDEAGTKDSSQAGQPEVEDLGISSKELPDLGEQQEASVVQEEIVEAVEGPGFESSVVEVVANSDVLENQNQINEVNTQGTAALFCSGAT